MVVIGGGVINGGEIVCDIINREVKIDAGKLLEIIVK